MKLSILLSALGLALGVSGNAFAQAVTPGHQPDQPQVQLKMPVRGNFFGPVTGVGEGQFSSGDRYEGELKNGKPDGIGKMSYMLGGAYEGEWKDGRRNGKGILTLAGSGKRVEARFVDDVRVDVPAERPDAPVALDKYALLSDEEMVGSHMRYKVAYSPLPLDRGFEELTPEQKRLVRSWYPALNAGDDPPYPLKGGKELAKLLVQVIRFRPIKDDVLLYVSVGPDGEVTSVRTASYLDTRVRDIVAAAAGLMKYRPAQCGGQPCAGVVPFNVTLSFNM